jgi:hypothetical protein
MKPEEYAGLAAIPFFGVLSLVFLDGLFGFLAVRKGIEIDHETRQVRFPHWYWRKTVKIPEIQNAKTSFKMSRDKEFRTHYTYYIELDGSFGRKRLSFKSEETRNRVFQILNGCISSQGG